MSQRTKADKIIHAKGFEPDLSHFKVGDEIYDTQWECFAIVKEFSDGLLYHSNTPYKMVVSINKSWIKLKPRV